MHISEVIPLSFYPGTAPIPAHKILVDGESILEIYCKENRTPGEDELVKSYVVYYMKAPFFVIDFVDNVDIKTISVEKLIELCMDNGIDPF